MSFITINLIHAGQIKNMQGGLFLVNGGILNDRSLFRIFLPVKQKPILHIYLSVITLKCFEYLCRELFQWLCIKWGPWNDLDLHKCSPGLPGLQSVCCRLSCRCSQCWCVFSLRRVVVFCGFVKNTLLKENTCIYPSHNHFLACSIGVQWCKSV